MSLSLLANAGMPSKTNFRCALSLVGKWGLWQLPRVDLSNYLRMDPHLLVGLVNTELRNHSESLDDLVKTHHLDLDALVEKLAKVDYIYQESQRQFR